MLQHLKKAHTIVNCIWYIFWLQNFFLINQDNYHLFLKHYPILVYYNYYKFYPSTHLPKWSHLLPLPHFLQTRWLYALWHYWTLLSPMYTGPFIPIVWCSPSSVCLQILKLSRIRLSFEPQAVIRCGLCFHKHGLLFGKGNPGNCEYMIFMSCIP